MSAGQANVALSLLMWQCRQSFVLVKKPIESKCQYVCCVFNNELACRSRKVGRSTCKSQDLTSTQTTYAQTHPHIIKKHTMENITRIFVQICWEVFNCFVYVSVYLASAEFMLMSWKAPSKLFFTLRWTISILLGYSTKVYSPSCNSYVTITLGN